MTPEMQAHLMQRYTDERLEAREWAQMEEADRLTICSWCQPDNDATNHTICDECFARMAKEKRDGDGQQVQ